MKTNFAAGLRGAAFTLLLAGTSLAGLGAISAYAQQDPPPPPPIEDSADEAPATPGEATSPDAATPAPADGTVAAVPGAGGAMPAPIPPTVKLTNADGSPLVIGTEQVTVPALLDSRGYPVFSEPGPNGKLVPVPIAYDGDAPAIGEDGKADILVPEEYPTATLKGADGQPLKDATGKNLTGLALIGQDGRPVKDAAGENIALPVRLNAQGTPDIGADGKTQVLATDIPEQLPLMGPSGQPIDGPSGVLMVPIEKSPDGRPVLGVDGRPIRVAIKTNEQGQPLLGADGQPIPATSDEEAKETITPVSMFLKADIVVQSIMTMLLISSVVTWTILFGKLSYFSSLNRRTDKFLQDFRNANRLQDAVKNVPARDARNPLVQMLKAAVHEYDVTMSQGAASGEKREHLTQRISAVMSIAQSSGSQDLGSGMGIFATVGSIAPFVGLLGTVWGIMNSFIGIANTNTTNLAVVAPGIAEALFATAIGLFAAIPAVIFYNIFSRKIASYNTRLDNFAGELLTRVSRQLDREV